MVEPGFRRKLLDRERPGVLHRLEDAEPVADEVHRAMQGAGDVADDFLRDLLCLLAVDLFGCRHRCGLLALFEMQFRSRSSRRRR